MSVKILLVQGRFSGLSGSELKKVPLDTHFSTTFDLGFYLVFKFRVLLGSSLTLFQVWKNSSGSGRVFSFG